MKGLLFLYRTIDSNLSISSVLLLEIGHFEKNFVSGSSDSSDISARYFLVLECTPEIFANTLERVTVSEETSQPGLYSASFFNHTLISE